MLERGGTIRSYNKNQSVFFEGDVPGFYYQVVEGSVRMFSVNESGREYVDGIFKKGESFGEHVLFIDEPYPLTAVANEDTLLIKIGKEEFLNILKEFPDILFQFARILAKRVHNKSLAAKAISVSRPEQRVLSVFKTLKERYGVPGLKNYRVELSRQQLADMIGFRVETVIRTIKRLEKRDLFKIQKGKIYL